MKLIYPIWGGATFHPLAHGRLLIYLSATPGFFGMVRLVYFLSSSRVAQWSRGAAMLACAAGICASIYLAASTNMPWPNPSGNLVIAGAHIVAPSSNRIIDGQNIYISNGRIVEISPLPIHPGWPRLDARNRWLIAGLIRGFPPAARCGAELESVILKVENTGSLRPPDPGSAHTGLANARERRA